jgi:hypothetical protein
MLAGIVWAAGCGTLWLLGNAPDRSMADQSVPPGVRVWDVPSGAEIIAPRGIWRQVYSQAGDYVRRLVQLCKTGRWPPPRNVTVAFSPEGRLLIPSQLEAAAEPPSLSWFLGGSALLALPIAGLAWRRVRRLERAGARG